MKALLVADDEKAINNISEVLKSAGYDTIVYKWLLKALDNIEEIAPHLIIVSTADYPRHWKTLAQYASTGFGDYSPQVILYTDENFDEEEKKKAEALHVRGIFDSIDVDGLDCFREILKKTDDIFSGYLTEEEQSEISVDDLLPHANKFVEAKVEEKGEESEDKEEANTETEDKEEANAETEDENEEAVATETEDENFDELVSKFEETNEANASDSNSENIIENDEDFDDIEKAEEEAIGDEEAINRLEEIADDEKAADRLEEIVDDEKAADKLERMSGNEEIPTVDSILSEPFNEDESTALPGIEELKNLLNENNFEEKENDVIIEKSEEINQAEEDAKDESIGENTMADEQSIDEKLAAIMNANRADQKEKAEALKLDSNSSSVSFVFTNPITLAMVSGVARNYNGLVLEFTPDIPGFIMNLSPGTKIEIASIKIDDKIENVFAEVMSNDAKKLALAIKKIS